LIVDAAVAVHGAPVPLRRTDAGTNEPIGVDRLVMVLSGRPIRSTPAFPLLRPGTARDAS
jgi:hypothetical protein